MASAANSFRMTAAEMLKAQTQATLQSTGILLKSYRDYSSPGNPSMTQQEVATSAGTNQSVVSDLERGKKIPANKVLGNILTTIGLDPKHPEGKAVFNVLVAIRDNSEDIAKLKKHKP